MLFHPDLFRSLLPFLPPHLHPPHLLLRILMAKVRLSSEAYFAYIIRRKFQKCIHLFPYSPQPLANDQLMLNKTVPVFAYCKKLRSAPNTSEQHFGLNLRPRKTLLEILPLHDLPNFPIPCQLLRKSTSLKNHLATNPSL